MRFTTENARAFQHRAVVSRRRRHRRRGSFWSPAWSPRQWVIGVTASVIVGTALGLLVRRAVRRRRLAEAEVDELHDEPMAKTATGAAVPPLEEAPAGTPAVNSPTEKVDARPAELNAELDSYGIARRPGQPQPAPYPPRRLLH